MRRVACHGVTEAQVSAKIVKEQIEHVALRRGLRQGLRMPCAGLRRSRVLRRRRVMALRSACIVKAQIWVPLDRGRRETDTSSSTLCILFTYADTFLGLGLRLMPGWLADRNLKVIGSVRLI